MRHRPVGIIDQIIREIQPDTRTIGLEAGDGMQYFWSLSLLKDIIASQPDITFTDGSLAIQRARMVKTPWEIERIRYVCEVTEKAILETGKQIVAGKTTEKDVSKGIAKRMAEGGVDKISYLTVTSGATSTARSIPTQQTASFKKANTFWSISAVILMVMLPI